MPSLGIGLGIHKSGGGGSARELHADVAAWRDAVATNSGVVSPAWVRAVDNRLVRPLVAAGLWDDTYFVNLMCGGDFLATQVNLVQGAAPTVCTDINFVSADYLSVGPGAGLKGNGTNKYRQINMPQNHTQNSLAFGMYVTDWAGYVVSQFLCGPNGGVSGQSNFLVGGTSSLNLRINTNAGAGVATAPPTGLVLGSRVDANNVLYKGNAAAVASFASTSQAVAADLGWYIHARGAGFPWIGRSPLFICFNRGLLTAELNTVEPIINNLMTYIGADAY